MTSSSSNPTITETFRALKERQHIGLVPFLPAGYPNLDTTVAALHTLQDNGASVIEIGFPFSDPIADGPVIQEAFTVALAQKLKIGDIFKAVSGAKATLLVPLVAMVSYSIVFRFGIERFAQEARQAGFAGLIVPDLPPPEAQSVSSRIQKADLDTILLVAPTTTAVRRKEIAGLCTGFVYYLSVSGTTGERDKLPADLSESVRELKSHTDRPICVGFGIHQPQHLAQLASIADGAIVGTAYVRRMKQHLTETPTQIAKILGTYTRELLSQVR